MLDVDPGYNNCTHNIWNLWQLGASVFANVASSVVTNLRSRAFRRRRQRVARSTVPPSLRVLCYCYIRRRGIQFYKQYNRFTVRHLCTAQTMLSVRLSVCHTPVLCKNG